MFKAERFVREYASYQKKYVKEKAFFFTEEQKEDAIKKIDRTVKFRQAGLITVDEALKMIMEVV